MWDQECGTSKVRKSGNHSRKESAYLSKPNRCRRVRVKRKGPSVFLFLLLLIAGVAFATPVMEGEPVSAAEVMAWLAAGRARSRGSRLVEARGITSVPGKEQIRQLEAAGADANLLRALAQLRPSAVAQPSISSSPSSATSRKTVEIPA